MNNAYLLKFKSHGKDNDGKLTAYENNTGVPFPIKRVYTVVDELEGVMRGYHAHKALEQLFVCLQGEIEVYCEDLNGKQKTFILNNQCDALYCGVGVWHTLTYRNNAILMVLASDKYDESDYIRNYDDFCKLKEDINA